MKGKAAGTFQGSRDVTQQPVTVNCSKHFWQDAVEF